MRGTVDGHESKPAHPQLVHGHSKDVPLTGRSRGISRYAVAFVLVIFAVIVSDYSKTHHFTLAYVPCLGAAVIAALLGGMGPGIFAAIMGALLIDYFVISRGQLFEDPGALDRVLLYLGISV